MSKENDKYIRDKHWDLNTKLGVSRTESLTLLKDMAKFHEDQIKRLERTKKIIQYLFFILVATTAVTSVAVGLLGVVGAANDIGWSAAGTLGETTVYQLFIGDIKISIVESRNQLAIILKELTDSNKEISKTMNEEQRIFTQHITKEKIKANEVEETKTIEPQE